MLTRLHSQIARTGLKSARTFSSAPMDASKLEIEKTTQPKEKLPPQELTFGTTFTDHMLEIDWSKQNGWSNPKIRPYGPFSLDPSCAVFHYAIECFEGLKAYRDADDNIRMFRPDMNMKRMDRSMNRLLLPSLDQEEMIKLMKELVKVDKDWVPKGEGYSLYIRPTAISTHKHVGVGESEEAKVFVIMSPVGPYYPEGFNPVKLYASDKYVRAWPGGTGNAKLGSNYGPTIKPQMEVHDKGYSQYLWLFGEDHEITEVGTMNLFVYMINKEGEKELITPSLDRGDILPGVTRDSILNIAREMGDFKVSERKITIADIRDAVHENRMLEVFGSGTAAVITPVSTIYYDGEDLKIPLNGPDGKSGELTNKFWSTITDIQYGRKKHPWSVLVE